jgi:hypothetical protein
MPSLPGLEVSSMKVGQTYYMIDPDYNTDDCFTLRRLILPRVSVTLLKRHRASLRGHYEVEYLGRRYRTGRLEKIKKCRY